MTIDVEIIVSHDLTSNYTHNVNLYKNTKYQLVTLNSQKLHFYARLARAIVKKYFSSNQHEPIETDLYRLYKSEMKKHELEFNGLILFNYNYNKRKTQTV